MPESADELQRDLVHYDLVQLTMAMMIAAVDPGVGTGHASMVDQDLAQRILRFSSGRRNAWMLGRGAPADRALEPIGNLNRRPFETFPHAAEPTGINHH